MPFAPDALKLASLRITARTNAHRERSPYSFTQTSYNFMGGMWAAELDLAHLAEEDHRTAWAWVLGLEGQAGSFQMYALDYTGAQRPFAANPTLAAETLQRGNIVSLTVGNGEALSVGDHITLGQNLHAVASVDPVAGTTQRVTVWPRLRAAHAIGASVEVLQPWGSWALARPDQTYQRQLSGQRSQRLSLIEAL